MSVSSDTAETAERSSAATVPEASSAELAAAIKSLRNKSQLTQAELAKQAGVSTSFISQLERSHTDVTVTTLNRICAALDTTIGHLFSPQAQHGRIIRKDNYRFLDYNGVAKFVLTREEMIDVDVCLFEFPPGSSTGLRTPPGTTRTELWICKSEFLGIELGTDVHILREGDSLDFASAQQNVVYNPGPNPCEALLIIKNHQ